MALIEPVSEHRLAVEDLPAQDIIDAIVVNNVYMLYKTAPASKMYCYIKVTDKTPITLPGEQTPYDCNITGPAVYIETTNAGEVKTGEIGIRTISNLISNKTHIASDNWLIYTSNITEYNSMVDEVVSCIIYTPPDLNHLSFTSKQNGSTVRINSLTNTGAPPDFEYSYDAITWTSWPYTTTGPSSNIYTHTFSTITLNYNERIYVRSHATTLNIGASANTYSRFFITGKIAAAGNIQSLINYSNTVPSFCYYNLFNGCEGLIEAPVLPVTTLADYCYTYMFYGCSNLTTTPALPATTLANFCYRHMFRGCTSLTAAPELPATTLRNYCYQYMFYGCTSLTTVPRLPATALTNHCYQYMFYGCSHITEGVDLQHVISTAFECCNYMYYNCSQLSSAITPRISSWNTQQFVNWLGGVAPTGIVYKPNDLIIPTDSANGVPTGWTVVNYE